MAQKWFKTCLSCSLFFGKNQIAPMGQCQTKYSFGGATKVAIQDRAHDGTWVPLSMLSQGGP